MKAVTVVSAPFMPTTAEHLWHTLNLEGSVHMSKWDEAFKRLEAGHKIVRARPLFQKIDADEKKLDEMLAVVREKMARTA